MRKTHILFLTLFATTAPYAVGQTAADDFEVFRQSLLAGQNEFRDDLMSNYAEFLDSAWEDFEIFKAQSRNPKPKPATPPTISPSLQSDSPTISSTPPEPIPADTLTSSCFTFLGIPIDAPQTSLRLSGNPMDGSEFAESWRNYLAEPAAAQLATDLGTTASSIGLNDFLTFEFVTRFVEQKFDEACSNAQISLAHYLLNSLGYDVRIALSDSHALLLVPAQQTIYGRPYMMIDSRKFYVFADNISASSRISTCRLPDDAVSGRALDMHFTSPLDLPMAPREFNLSYGGISLNGQLNGNIYPLLYHYPQTDMEVYATSVIDPELRANLVSQLKSQLNGRTQLEAVNALLQFTQSALDYATDEINHGFEKPYFLEEWLYYPKNDCEDRAVFYSYMLWNVLGVECQMITYPGHESVALRLDTPIEGDNYRIEGQPFYISDPTYIGAVTGQCMPQFIETSPQIEYHYKR